MKKLLITVLVAALMWIVIDRQAEAQDPSKSGPESADPFARSQLSDPVVSGSPVAGASIATFRGFVDVGFIQIRQSGPAVAGGDLSWAFGNSQFTFFSESSTFAVNEVDLSLEAQREEAGILYGARISIDYYPSRDSEAYTIPGSDREFDVDEAFTFAEFLNAWNTRIVLGRAPGFVTLAQQEADSPDLRLIGHTYVFQAGGGYPYGLQLITRPAKSISIKLGVANGGMGAYSFFPGDDSTLNRATARDSDNKNAADKLDDKTFYAAIEVLPVDSPAGAGTLKVGIAAANNPGLTFNSTTNQAEPYDFQDAYLAYRFGALEFRLEYASLEAYYELSLMQFDASMWYLLFSLHIGADHLLTLRTEQITYTTGLAPDIEGDATKFGITYRLRFTDSVALKMEAVRETQSPQFSNPDQGQDLTTDVLTSSWVYAY